MLRYFLEVFYKGDGLSGFQVQENAVTVQSEIQKAFAVYFRKDVFLTGSSRTDAGVHALQNYFHFDWEEEFPQKSIYNLNAILPLGIVIQSVRLVQPGAHCRFQAVSREYRYYICNTKNPFLADRSWYLPYSLDEKLLDICAEKIKSHTQFEAFSKRNTQVKTFQCFISESEWTKENGCLVYHVKGNRFLRGMVRALVGTMIKVGRGSIDIQEFDRILKSRELSSADFSAPAKGLFLVRVSYPEEIFL
ncbi:MAG: tRNA pseudouridine(38-40) synthase TruA [Lacibacter sp.]